MPFLLVPTGRKCAPRSLVANAIYGGSRLLTQSRVDLDMKRTGIQERQWIDFIQNMAGHREALQFFAVEAAMNQTWPKTMTSYASQDGLGSLDTVDIGHSVVVAVVVVGYVVDLGSTT